MTTRYPDTTNNDIETIRHHIKKLVQNGCEHKYKNYTYKSLGVKLHNFGLGSEFLYVTLRM